MSTPESWKRFVESRLWEVLAPEVCVRVRLSRQPESIAAIAVAHGQPGLELFEDVAMFDALWSGEPIPVTGLSMLDGEVLRIVSSEPLAPRAVDLELAEACLQIVLGEVQRVTLSDGTTIEVERY